MIWWLLFYCEIAFIFFGFYKDYKRNFIKLKIGDIVVFSSTIYFRNEIPLKHKYVFLGREKLNMYFYCIDTNTHVYCGITHPYNLFFNAMQKEIVLKEKFSQRYFEYGFFFLRKDLVNYGKLVKTST